MLILLTGLIFLISVESLFWSFSVNRHANWLRLNPEYDRRLAVPHSILGFGAIVTGLLTLFLWLWFIYEIVHIQFNLENSHQIILLKFLIVFWTNLVVVHMWAIVARYSCLHTIYWPYFSKFISNTLIKYFSLTEVHKYCHTLNKWNKIDKLEEQHKNLILKFGDKMNDILWTKDVDLRFTYVNKNMAKRILLSDQQNVLGRTHHQIAEELRCKGMKYTFDMGCEHSDKEIKKTMNPSRFISSGIIGDNNVYFHVFKSPIYFNGKFTGLIGFGRNITFEVSKLENIDLLIRAGDIEQALILFSEYRHKFINLEHYEDMYGD